jgi:hypothetical protein
MTAFNYGQTFAITTGDISTTNVGTFSNVGNSVCGRLSNADGTSFPGSTVTLTISVGSESYTLPELDLSDANAVVPFTLPLGFGAGITVTYEATVTGSSGDWGLQMAIDTNSSSSVALSLSDGSSITMGLG